MDKFEGVDRVVVVELGGGEESGEYEELYSNWKEDMGRGKRKFINGLENNECGMIVEWQLGWG